MSKRVLLLSSTPRKGGNSELLSEAFASGAEEAGHMAEIVRLRTKRVHPCIACDACKKNGDRCTQKDDADAIIDQMTAADVIVLASPVYFYSISAQMKTLIDRCYARYTAITGKEFYFIVTAADGSKSAIARTIECFRGFTACLGGSNERGIVSGTGLWNTGDAKGSQAADEAHKLGKAV